MITKIYIKLLDEDIDVWRPVEAKKLSTDIYQIIEENINASEHWEFNYHDVVKCIDKNAVKLIKKAFMNIHNTIITECSFSQLLTIIEWCGLQTINEIQKHILPIFDDGEFGEYKYLFENLEVNRGNQEFLQTQLPIDLVTKIINKLGMVLFYRAKENALFSINYEHQKPDEIGAFIRKNGYEAILDYHVEDETAIKTSDALIEYGFDIVEKAYERTRAKL
jgi:hypothetical protein